MLGHSRGAGPWRRILVAWGCAGALALPVDTVHGQHVASPYDRGSVVERLDGELERRRRLSDVVSDTARSTWSIRRASSGVFAGLRLGEYRVIAPWVEWGRNQALPSGGNDGALWAGRGANVRVSPGGLALADGWVRLIVAPEYVWSRNEAFPLVVDPWWSPPVEPPFSPWASPPNISQWTGTRYSADVPWRMGGGAYSQWHPGASGAWLRGGPVEAGITAEDEWWGPSYRNALVLSSNAPGIPRLAVRSHRPFSIPGGELTFSIGSGSTVTSNAFLAERSPLRGSWAGATVVFSPRGAPGFSLGLARAVYTTSSAPSPLASAAWLLRSVGRPAAEAVLDTTFAGGRDQVASVFARWVPPGGGTELYAEVGRAEQPASWRDLWVDPDHSAAITLGAVRAITTSRATWRLHAELTSVEQTSTFRHRPQGSWYTSPTVRQGYTHQGQTIGAALGPGGSAQWLSFERVTARTSLGGFLQRARVNQDAFYTLPWPAKGDGLTAEGWCEFDTPTQAGVRGSLITAVGVLHASAAWERRFNVFWQNNAGCPTTPDKRARDVQGAVLSLGWTTAFGFRQTVAPSVRGRRPVAAHSLRPTWYEEPESSTQVSVAEAGANSEAERRGRMLSLVEGRTASWTIRPFAPSVRLALTPTHSERWFNVVRPTVGLTYNSTFAYGILDGPLWTGRGPTAWASGGVALKGGPVRVVLAPTIFRASNWAYPIVSGNRTGAAQYADPEHPTRVDLPQRFGDQPYSRFDFGQSTVRVDALGLAAGATTEGQSWGPAAMFPLLLSTNAPGIPRLFFGTGAPWHTWIGGLQFQVQWGDLRSSRLYDSVEFPFARRFGTGVIAVWQPRGVDGLELGVSRYFHARWRSGALPGRYWTRALGALGRASLAADRAEDGENQLASAFFRWHIPGSGTEFYGELGRDDASWDRRDLLIAPTQLSGVMAGAAHAWDAGGRVAMLRLEAMSTSYAPNDRRRHSPVIYTHSTGTPQGHTVLGQLLGPPTGVGNSGGAALQFDVLSNGERRSFGLLRLQRRRRASEGGPWVHDTRATDVQHALTAEQRLDRRALHTVGAAWVWNANRDFGADRSNLQVWVQWSPPLR